MIASSTLRASKERLLTSLPKREITETEIILSLAKWIDDATALRVAANLEKLNTVPNSPEHHAPNVDADLQPHPQSLTWDSSDKHRVLFVVKKEALRQLDQPQVTKCSTCMWSQGRLHLALSAPRTSFFCWQMKTSPEMETTSEEVVGILLSWVGNRCFAHEAEAAKRRGVGVSHSLFLTGHGSRAAHSATAIGDVIFIKH